MCISVSVCIQHFIQIDQYYSVPNLASIIKYWENRALRISSNSGFITYAGCVHACMSYSAWVRLRGWVVTNVTTDNSFIKTILYLPT